MSLPYLPWLPTPCCRYRTYLRAAAELQGRGNLLLLVRHS